MSESIEQLVKKAKWEGTWSGYTQEQLSTAFDGVRNADHWKGPIDALVPEDELTVTVLAIIFYTATEPKASWVESKEHFRVTSEGYWAGPAGDH